MQKEQIEGFRLSPQQNHIWLLQESHLTSPYRVQCAVLIEGNLNIEFFQIALQDVVNRYEILRTYFSLLPGMTIPLQVINQTYEISILESNLSSLSWQEQDIKIESLFTELRQIPFARENNPPLHTHIITLSSAKHLFLISLSALLADSITLKYLINQISSSYLACLQGSSIVDEPMQYVDIAEWQNEVLAAEESDIGKEYWRKQNIKFIHNFQIGLEKKYLQTLEFKANHISLILSENLVKYLEILLQKYDVSFSDFLLTCWLILIKKIAIVSDIYVGIISDSRKYEELEQAIGLLSKYVPLTCHLEENFKFIDILNQVNESVNNAYEWQEFFTWEEIIQPEHQALASSYCPVCFEFEEWSQKYCVDDISFSLEKQYSCIERFNLKLSCLRTRDSLIAEFHFDSGLYNYRDIKKLSEQFQILLESASKNPEAVIGELDILSVSDRQKLLVEFNNTTADYPQDICIHQLFEQQVERTPDEIAVVFVDAQSAAYRRVNQQLSYAQLNARANQLAHHLQQRGVGAEVLVALYAERSLELVIGMLGILKAGAAYVPLDPAYPKERLALMLADIQASVLLTQKNLVQTLVEHTTEVICLDTDWDVIKLESQENPNSGVKPENLAYVLFTSGSTGKPKGVTVEHRQICNYINAIVDRLDLCVCTSFAHISTFAADLGNTTLFPSLCKGGCLHLVSQDCASNPEALAEYFHHHSIDCLKIVPSHLAALLTSSHPEQILPKQRLILGGEACSGRLIEQIQQLNTECRVFNHYGPTEATVGVLTYAIPTQYHDNTVPIGRAIANTQIYLLNSDLQPLPIGVPGELYIGGVGVARGYLNQPDLTNERFIPNPFGDGRLYKTGDLARYLPDGNIEYLGRIDQQVKIRGFRIELGEIEITLKQHPGVREAVILVHEHHQTGDQRLVAYVVAEKQSVPTNSELREFLQEKLPKYMVPSVFVQLKALPLLPNGKLDRQALPIPDTSNSELPETFVAPRTQVEEVLAGIWAEILGIEQVGIYDNFFDLGGHSLLATQVISRLRQAFDVELPLLQLFEHPTVADLGVMIALKLAEKTNEETLVEILAQLKELSEEEVEAVLTKQGGANE